MSQSPKRSSASKARRKLSPKQLLIVLVLAVILTVIESRFLPTDGGSDPVPTDSALSAPTSVHFLDVGQGDATLFVSGEQAVLIDASTSDAGDTIVAYLDELGIDHLDAVVATHPHADHIGGMRKIIQNVDTDTIYMSNGVSGSVTYEKLLDTIDNLSIPVVVPEIGDVLTLDSGASFTFLSPDPEDEFDNLNNYSLVCLFEAGDTRVLMMGDAETPIENQLLASDADLRCDVIKLGHHGSSTSSSRAFLKAAAPTTAIISCAEVNDYGHPHRETLETLAALSIDDVRYTYNGTIVIDLTESEAA